MEEMNDMKSNNVGDSGPGSLINMDSNFLRGMKPIKLMTKTTTTTTDCDVLDRFVGFDLTTNMDESEQYQRETYPCRKEISAYSFDKSDKGKDDHHHHHHHHTGGSRYRNVSLDVLDFDFLDVNDDNDKDHKDKIDDDDDDGFERWVPDDLNSVLLVELEEVNNEENFGILYKDELNQWKRRSHSCCFEIQARGWKENFEGIRVKDFYLDGIMTRCSEFTSEIVCEKVELSNFLPSSLISTLLDDSLHVLPTINSPSCLSFGRNYQERPTERKEKDPELPSSVITSDMTTTVMYYEESFATETKENEKIHANIYLPTIHQKNAFEVVCNNPLSEQRDESSFAFNTRIYERL